MEAKLNRTRIPVQIDIAFGDAVTPGPTVNGFPVLLDLPAPHLLIYPRETVVAEKFETLVKLGPPNSRMKDFYDLWIFAQDFAFDGAILKDAIHATFRRRKTQLPTTEPIALTPVFADDATKRVQWQAFLNRNDLRRKETNLARVIPVISRFVMPPALAAAKGARFTKKREPGKNWV